MTSRKATSLATIHGGGRTMAFTWSLLIAATVAPTLPPRDPPEPFHGNGIVVPHEGPSRLTASLGQSSTATNGVVAHFQAKLELTPELVGQALVYRQFALYAGALVRETLVFAEKGSASMRRAALDLGLTVVVEPL